MFLKNASFLSAIFATLNVVVRAEIITANNTDKLSGEEKKCKILITHPEVPKVAIDILSRSCELIITQIFPPDRVEVLEKVKGVDGIFWAGLEKLNAEVLDAAGLQLKAISTMSAGFDHVDVPELKRRKIPLGHTPIVVNDPTAEIAIALMLAAGRRFHEGRHAINTNTWQNFRLNWLLGKNIRGSVVGFFGFGNIAQSIAKRLAGFDIDHIIYTTRRRLPEEIEAQFNATKVDFDTLLAESDYLLVAAPLTNETADIFNATAFSKMKNSAVFINVARGGLVNTNDLYEALETNEIFSAGLDVVTPEPLPSDHPLLSLHNLVLLPHLATATERTRNDMATVAARNVLRALAGKPMISPVYE
ncbi:glyoxylate reductase/hydroxypyruvate reductase-like [Eurosta solidaginis]|uniref:glyoxylate reductase/hydroxypyruvate reductase-like n=1 Tax=Eurosta solidaginis TaxID=178769 RepID=UPI003530947F